jgi:hypothetical protein
MRSGGPASSALLAWQSGLPITTHTYGFSFVLFCPLPFALTLCMFSGVLHQPRQCFEFVFRSGLPCSSSTAAPLLQAVIEDASYCVMDLCKYCTHRLGGLPVSLFQSLQLSSMPTACVRLRGRGVIHWVGF